LSVALVRQAWTVKLSNRRRPVQPTRSAFAGFRFPPDVIVIAVRLYLRYNLSYRDVEELLLERGVPDRVRRR
jgi:transposase-like protein